MSQYKFGAKPYGNNRISTKSDTHIFRAQLILKPNKDDTKLVLELQQIKSEDTYYLSIDQKYLHQRQKTLQKIFKDQQSIFWWIHEAISNEDTFKFRILQKGGIIFGFKDPKTKRDEFIQINDFNQISQYFDQQRQHNHYQNELGNMQNIEESFYSYIEVDNSVIRGHSQVRRIAQQVNQSFSIKFKELQKTFKQQNQMAILSMKKKEEQLQEKIKHYQELLTTVKEDMEKKNQTYLRQIMGQIMADIKTDNIKLFEQMRKEIEQVSLKKVGWKNTMEQQIDQEKSKVQGMTGIIGQTTGTLNVMQQKFENQIKNLFTLQKQLKRNNETIDRIGQQIQQFRNIIGNLQIKVNPIESLSEKVVQIEMRLNLNINSVIQGIKNIQHNQEKISGLQQKFTSLSCRKPSIDVQTQASTKDKQNFRALNKRMESCQQKLELKQEETLSALKKRMEWCQRLEANQQQTFIDIQKIQKELQEIIEVVQQNYQLQTRQCRQLLQEFKKTVESTVQEFKYAQNTRTHQNLKRLFENIGKIKSRVKILQKNRMPNQ